MAVGKNKGLSKAGKKGSKKKIVDPFTKKDWYSVKAPSVFQVRDIGKTLVNRTQGAKLATDGLKGRVFEVAISDLQNDNDAERSFRKFKLIAESVIGHQVLTNFHGMTLTTEKLRCMVKKWQTLIEANVDVKTTDGYLLRVFCIGYTQKDPNSKRKSCYAQHTQVKAIRKIMTKRMTKEVSECDIKELVKKLIPVPDFLAKDIEKACRGIYPLHDVQIRKIKVLKKPRFDHAKLMEMHDGDSGEIGTGIVGGEMSEDTGERVDKPDNYEPPILASV